jgi:LPS-assembly lipoprotein
MRMLAVALLLGACGFAPAYAPGGPGEALRGRVTVEAPDTADGYAIRARLEDRLGLPEAEAGTLSVTVDVAREPAAIDQDGAITRYDLDGTATWSLSTADSTTSGSVDAFTGFSATGSTVATRAAEEDARARLMTLLADAVVARLLLLPADALP